MRSFNEYLSGIDRNKMEYDTLNWYFSEEDVKRMEREFTPSQFKYIYRLINAVSLAHLRQYHEFLHGQSAE